jgi:dihydrolipoamide dehydrogenase
VTSPPLTLARGSDPLDVDVAVLGAGTAGLAAYRAAVARTPRVVMIESGPYGTTCARVGCMPSKLLIAAADVVHHAKHAQPFGVSIGDVVVDRRAVLERVRTERDRFVGLVTDTVDRIPDEHKVRGHARFLSRDTLDVDGKVIRARSVVIATGSSAQLPPGFDRLGDRLVINDHVFDWESLPRSVAVFGAGVIGLELGQALHRLDVRVRIFGRSGVVGGLTDPAIRELARRTLSAELALDVRAVVHGVTREGDAVTVDFESGGERVRETFDYALAATGRRPNVEGLGLEHTDLELDARGVPKFSRHTLQCGDSSIFLAGDASHDAPVLHEAADEGKIAGENAARFPDVRPGARRSLLTIAFSDPQIAIAGTSWKAIAPRIESGEVIAGEMSFEDQGRSRVMLANRGRLHVYAEASGGRFLGAEMFGPRAEHIGHLLAWAHQSGLTIDRMLEMPFYHPVIEEGLRTALRAAHAKLRV